MQIKTNRLILREFRDSDIKEIVANINNFKVSQYLSVVPCPYKMKDAKWWVNHCKEEAKEKPRKGYNFAIVLKKENKVIGGLGFSNIDNFSNTAEIGYWIGKPYWNKGIMSEAIKPMINFGFNKLKLIRIHWPVFIENKASNHLAIKFGAVLEGTLRKVCRAKSTGKIHNANVYGLLKEDWEKKNNAKK